MAKFRDGESHDEWLKRYNKTKAGKMFNLVHDVRGFKANLEDYDKMSHMATALSIATKGTRMETDARTLIEMMCPEYYQDKPVKKEK